MPRQARLDARPPRLSSRWQAGSGNASSRDCSGDKKKEIVTDNTDRKNFITRLGNLVTDTDMGVYSWALMINHAHILIRS